MAGPQTRGCGLLTVKYLVFSFNLIFCLSGLALIAVGGVAQGFFRQYIQFFEGQYQTPAVGLIILGTIILVVSFFGCCGAKRDSVVMLWTFIGMMVVLLLCEIAAGITVAVRRHDIGNLVQKNLNETMSHYKDPKALPTVVWNEMQHKHRCCGVMNYLDWEKTPYGVRVSGVPDSCCVVKKPDCGRNVFGSASGGKAVVVPKIYSGGCYQALRDAAKSRVGAIGGVIAGLVFVQILAICMSSYLIKSARQRYDSFDGSEEFPLM
ncbi:CD63 antigen-like [Macrobrachium rosenbergii]|uniref:CD63 antigen-like n=1 Tax=Macrobrachium rosenbergii TaxID=79674 RepID=UPI0034D6975B